MAICTTIDCIYFPHHNLCNVRYQCSIHSEGGTASVFGPPEVIKYMIYSDWLDFDNSA